MKKILWLTLGMTLSTSLLAQQLTNPPPAAAIQPATADTNAPVASENAGATNAAPKAAEAKAPKAAAKKQTKKAVKKTAAPLPRTAPLTPGPAVVAASNVNVRGQAKLRSEVVARVTKGQDVIVLEEIVRNNSADDEPSAWAKILLPAGAPVWVHSSFISNDVVVPTQLNVRSGPGENYSILGRISRGSAVKVISAKEGWSQIEKPSDAYGFVAAQYLKQEPAPAIAALTAPKEGTPEAGATKETSDATVAMPETPTTPETVADAPVVAAAPGDVPAVPAPAVTEQPAAADSTNTVSATDTNTVIEEIVEEALPKRIVQREGVVRGTASIQAPSHFALVSPVTGKLINYLYTSSPSLDLRRYKGLRIIVTGEEALEERWGNTPVITIQKLELLEE